MCWHRAKVTFLFALCYDECAHSFASAAANGGNAFSELLLLLRGARCPRELHMSGRPGREILRAIATTVTGSWNRWFYRSLFVLFDYIFEILNLIVASPQHYLKEII